jgi:malonyl-CoA/methylmalonyl-CoA synthetase
VPLETIPLVARASAHGSARALIDAASSLAYDELLARSAGAATALLAGASDLSGARVAFLTPPGIDYVLAQWGTFRAGGVAVPLCTLHPAPELDYVLGDAGVSIAVAHPQYHAVLQPLAARRGIRFVSSEQLREGRGAELPRVDAERGAMLIYTSGTTGKPKAALSTHRILAAQIESVVQAWHWQPSDHVLHVLPLHHLHGILNLLCAALWAGATCELMPRFDADAVWERIADGHDLSLFMAVPTIYSKLIAAHERGRGLPLPGHRG